MFQPAKREKKEFVMRGARSQDGVQISLPNLLSCENCWVCLNSSASNISFKADGFAAA
jgi:hypothetical protein